MILCTYYRYGPNGTAICVYHAEFQTSLLFTEYRGIVDVLNFNRYRDELGVAENDEMGLLSVSATCIHIRDTVLHVHGLGLNSQETEGVQLCCDFQLVAVK